MGYLVSAPLQVFGTLQQASAQSNTAKYNAAVAGMNASIETQNAQIASQAGMQQAGMESLKTRAAVGDLVANQAASNIDVNSGSEKEARLSEQQIGELDALTVRSNATKQAYGYETQAVNQQAEQGLEKYEAKEDIQAGQIQAANTFLGQSQQAGNQFMQWQLASGGFTG